MIDDEHWEDLLSENDTESNQNSIYSFLLHFTAKKDISSRLDKLSMTFSRVRPSDISKLKTAKKHVLNREKKIYYRISCWWLRYYKPKKYFSENFSSDLLSAVGDTKQKSYKKTKKLKRADMKKKHSEKCWKSFSQERRAKNERRIKFNNSQI